MKNYIFFVFIFLILHSCSQGPSSTDDTEKPIVSILYPPNNSEFENTAKITIIADAHDNDKIKELKFYINGELESTITDAPYQYEWNTSSLKGTYTIRVNAFDNNNNIGVSEVLQVKINNNSELPFASFTVKPSSGSILTFFKFDASGSSDMDDSDDDLQVRWDWESDNIWDTESSLIKTATHKFEIEESYNVKLEVKDSNGLADTTRKQIAIVGLEIGTMTDIDDNVYQTVKIGNQWWMAENLKVTRYRNGETLPNVINQEEWDSLTIGAFCAYNNDAANVDFYGLLYNWHAINDSNNIAPQGWHVATQEEWQILVNYLGGNTIAGGKMKSSGSLKGDFLWSEPNVGANNESGLTGLPGGHRERSAPGSFESLGFGGGWWSVSEKDISNNTAWGLRLIYNDSTVINSGYNKQVGFSVRCVKD